MIIQKGFKVKYYHKYLASTFMQIAWKYMDFCIDYL